GSGSLLDQRLRYTTQAEVAFDRFLLAYLSRLQAGHLLGNLMKAFRGPPITPGLQHAATLPMQRIGEQKTGCITEVCLLVDNDQAFSPVAFQAYDFGKGPKLLGVSIAAPDRDRAETFWMGPPQRCSHGIHTLPLALPLDMPGAFPLADPVFAHVLNTTG